MKAFHQLSQTGTVTQYITTFEQQMNLMRRDNPALRDAYYMHSFIFGLHPYIQSHLECLEPTTLQKAMWFARRMEKFAPPPPPSRVVTPFYKKQTVVESAKPHTPSNNTAATVIQQEREKGICYKCKEPWFPGHKKVCKLANQMQIQALQETCPEDAELVYYTADDTEAPPPTDLLGYVLWRIVRTT